MPSDKGYVALWRDIEKQPWYKDSECVHLFTHLMIKASRQSRNVEANKVQLELQEGQLYATYETLSRATGITPTKVRRVIEKFEKLGQISIRKIKVNNRIVCQVITILGWKKWQKSDTPTDRPTDTPETAKTKGLSLTPDTLPDTPTDRQNNNVLNNNKKNADKNVSSHLEIRNKAFDYFWSKWSEGKKLIGKRNQAPKGETKTKFLSIMTDSHVEKIGIDGFRFEMQFMADYIEHCFADFAENQGKSDYFAFEKMYPNKFLGRKQWREFDEYKEKVA